MFVDWLRQSCRIQVVPWGRRSHIFHTPTQTRQKGEYSTPSGKTIHIHRILWAFSDGWPSPIFTTPAQQHRLAEARNGTRAGRG